MQVKVDREWPLQILGARRFQRREQNYRKGFINTSTRF
jgi:hypothetical protein